MPEDEIEGQGLEGQEIETPPVAEGSEGGSGINPAWNEMLEVLPSSLHSLVTPHLQKWDQNYQQGINKVHSEYEPYKPFLEQKIPVDQLNYGLQLMQAIEERPQDVIAALQKAMGVEEPPKANEPNTDEQGQFDENADFLNHPEVKRMQEMVQTMAQLFVQQSQTQQEVEEDQKLSAELDQLHASKGDFDEEWVLTKAAIYPDQPLEKFVDAYLEFEKGIIQKQRQPGPRVIGAGGGAPNNQVDMKKLDDSGRRQIVAQMLAQAAQQGQ